MAASEYFVSKAGLQFAPPGGEPVDVVGYSCDTDEGSAEAYARCEAIERLYTTPELMHARSDRIRAFRYPDLAVAVERPARRGDIFGSAFRSSRGPAIASALAELCERYLLQRIWQTGQPRLHRISPPRVISDDTTLQHFLVSGTSLIVTALSDQRRQIFVCGAAMRESDTESASHAAAEAIMLHDALATGDIPVYRSTERRRAFATLRGPTSALREKRFRDLIDSDRPRPRGDSTITTIFGPDSEILIHVVYEAPNACVALAELYHTPLTTPHEELAPPFF